MSGFIPRRNIYVHVRRGGKTLANTRLGKGDARCGRLSTKQRRIPGVRASRLRSGSYDIYVDNKPTFSRTQRPQFQSRVTIFTTFR